MRTPAAGRCSATHPSLESFHEDPALLLLPATLLGGCVVLAGRRRASPRLSPLRCAPAGGGGSGPPSRLRPGAGLWSWLGSPGLVNLRKNCGCRRGLGLCSSPANNPSAGMPDAGVPSLSDAVCPAFRSNP